MYQTWIEILRIKSLCLHLGSGWNNIIRFVDNVYPNFQYPPRYSLQTTQTAHNGSVCQVNQKCSNLTISCAASKELSNTELKGQFTMNCLLHQPCLLVDHLAIKKEI